MILEWTNPNKKAKGSNIDTGVIFLSAADIVRYLPRAAQIGFLSPFPSDWLGKGSKPMSSMMRLDSGFEMLFTYLCWPGLVYALWTWRKHLDVWVMLLFCSGMLIIFVLGTPNVGSLYRFRYPYIMPMVGLGFAGFLAFAQGLIKRRKKV